MTVSLPPDDLYNRALLERVAPAGWTNPIPKSRYDLVVVGGGTAGLVTAAGAAGLGAQVALIEQHLLGGDCLNFGCVPSKSLIAAGRAAASVRSAAAFGVHSEPARVDFGQVMERMRQVRAGLSVHDSAERFRSLGVDVYLGAGQFTGNDALQVADQTLRFRKAAICTGARAAVPAWAIDSGPGGTGELQSRIVTNETLFSLTELPPRLGIVGGGPIGCEMAQTFARLGSRVTLLDKEIRLLPRDDTDASALVLVALQQAGVDLRLGTQIHSVQSNEQEVAVTSRSIGSEQRMDRFDILLVATGRRPNIEGLGLDQAGVDSNPHGIVVDDHLRTTNPRIYAAGDVCSRYKFTHAADFLARIVIQNALFWGRAKASQLIIPWCTYTSPEVAHVGLLPDEAAAQGVAIQTFTQPLAGVDRAVLDGETDGFVKIHVKAGTDQIVGATIIGAHAGEIISEVTLAMRHRLGLKGLAATIHPYPTQADALRKIGDQYNRTRLSPWVKRLLGWWFGRTP
jgi:pyruvate/2-oxoglutarate dehydrogenase complex dihydrolipoamide dehydrogenase (E3) component